MKLLEKVAQELTVAAAPKSEATVVAEAEKVVRDYDPMSLLYLMSGFEPRTSIGII